MEETALPLKSASPFTRIRSGCSKWLGTRPWRTAEPFDRDTKYTHSFQAIIESGQVKTLPLPARSPNLNAYAERWVRSVKEKCLSKIILFGERSLRRALSEYVVHTMLTGIIKGSPTSF